MSEPKGLRYNEGKPELSYVLEAKHALAGAARVLTYGAVKYFRGNWRNGLKHTGIADCLLRHLAAYLAGEDNDKESGLPHVDHVLVNALFLAEMTRTYPELDDRAKVIQKEQPSVPQQPSVAEQIKDDYRADEKRTLISRIWLTPPEGHRIIVVQRGDGDVVLNLEKL